MHAISGIQLGDRRFSWWLVPGPRDYNDVEGIWINLHFSYRLGRRRALEVVAESLQRDEINWLQSRGDVWRLDLDGLRAFIDGWKSSDDWKTAANWMTGVVHVSPEVEIERKDEFGEEREETSVQFIMTREEIELSGSTRIFLSHKGVDKPLVRRLYNALRQLGFDPWLDENDMKAGTELERALLAGMKDSCAAVFFLTPAYDDENYLATEVNYAVAEKRNKRDRFEIISLRLKDGSGNFASVPELLQTYVWKEPATELEMLEEIVGALPIVVGEPRWRDRSE